MVLDRVIFLHMSGHIADPAFPFSGWIGKIHAEFAGGIFRDSLAAIALLDNGVTLATVECASLLGHEYTFITLP